MQHCTREGAPKLVEQCSYPLTARAAVDRVYTELGTFEVTPRGFRIHALAKGVSAEEAQARSGAPLHV